MDSHIEFFKKLAKCTNHKDIFLFLMQRHVRERHMQYFEHLYSDMGYTEMFNETTKSEHIMGPFHVNRHQESSVAIHTFRQCQESPNPPGIQMSCRDVEM